MANPTYNTFSQRMQESNNQQWRANFDRQCAQQKAAVTRRDVQALHEYNKIPSDIRKAGDEGLDECLGCTPNRKIACCIAFPLWLICIVSGAICLGSPSETERQIGTGILSGSAILAALIIVYLAKRVFCTSLHQSNSSNV